MIKLPEDINRRYEVPMYINGITITDNINVAVRIFKRKDDFMVGYFDENQIYKVRPLKEIEKEGLNLSGLAYYYYIEKEYFISSLGDPIFIPNGCDRNYVLDRKIYKQLKRGDSAKKLHRLAETTYLANHTYNEFQRKFHSVDKPIIIGDKKHFDYIKISVKCISTITKEDIMENKAQLDEWVLERLERSSSFRKYDVPISILEVSNLVLTRDKRLEYTFSIKKDLLQLQQEANE